MGWQAADDSRAGGQPSGDLGLPCPPGLTGPLAGFEHAVPYDKGGVTDAGNAGARSRRCHQVKQMPGWSVTQPKPGWHVWTSPTGRTYTQEPWRYIA